MAVDKLDTQQQQLLAQLATSIQRWHLSSIVQTLAQLGQALPVIASHLLLFSQPMLPFKEWRQTCGAYASIFEHSDGWQALINELEALQS